MDARMMEILANRQLKAGCAASFRGMCRLALRDGPFRTPKRPVLRSKTGRFASQNALFCNALSISRLDDRVRIAVFNIKMLTGKCASQACAGIIIR